MKIKGGAVSRFLTSILLSFVIVAVQAMPAHATPIPTETIYEGTLAESSESCGDSNCKVQGDDDVSTPIDIGFDFDFFGHTFSQTQMNINGVLHFGCASSDYSNTELPTNFDGSCDLEGSDETLPFAILAFWDDIITAPKGLYCTDDPAPAEGEECSDWDWDSSYPTLLYKTIGTPGSRKFIAQWTNMYLYSNPNIPLGTFQVILYEGSNEFQIQYRNLLGDPDRSSGSDATIGVQMNASNTYQYSFEGNNPIHAGMAIRYTLGEGYMTNDEASYDPVYLAMPGAPTRPELTYPENESDDVERLPNFEWDEVTNPDTYTLTIATDSNMADVVQQTTDIEETSFQQVTELDENTTYYWTVKAVNEVGEETSEVHSFTTGTHESVEPEEDTPSEDEDDDDGVDMSVEQEAPNDGDANDDGTPDSQQPKVTAIKSTVSNDYVVLESSSCTANTAVSIDKETTVDTQDDDSYQYPAGLLNFTLTGCSVGGNETITQYYYGDYDISKLALRKYNSTTHTYTTINNAVLSQVTIGGKKAVKAVYTVTDGGILDADGTANGTIVDPAGLGVIAVTAPNTGLAQATTPVSYLLLMSGGLVVWMSYDDKKSYAKKK